MMNINVVKYIHEPYEDYKIGYSIVESEGGLDVVRISRNKNGHIYASFMGVKIGDVWRPVRELRYRGEEASFFAEVMKQTIPLMPKEMSQPGAHKEEFRASASHSVIDPEYQQERMPF